MSSTWSVVGQYRRWAERCMTGDESAESVNHERNSTDQQTACANNERNLRRSETRSTAAQSAATLSASTAQRERGKQWQIKRVTCKVQRHGQSGEVQNNRHAINWPKTRTGTFVPQVYITAIGGGAGGSGALYEVSRESVSCDLFKPTAEGTVTTCRRVIPNSALNFAALGGASGGAIVAVPVQCPAKGCDRTDDITALSLSITVDVGIGGDGGLSQVILERDSKAPAQSHYQIYQAQEAARGTPGTPSMVHVEGFHVTPPLFLSTPSANETTRHHAPCTLYTNLQGFQSSNRDAVSKRSHIGSSVASSSSRHSAALLDVAKLPSYQTFQSLDLTTMCAVTNTAAIFQPCVAPGVGEIARTPLAHELSLQLGFSNPHDALVLPSMGDYHVAHMEQRSTTEGAGVSDYCGLPLPHSRKSALHAWHCADRTRLAEFQATVENGDEDGDDEQDDAFHYVLSQGGAGALAPYRLAHKTGVTRMAGDGGCGAAVPMFHAATQLDDAHLQQTFTCASSSSSFFDPIRATRGADGIVDIYWLEEITAVEGE